MDSKGDVKEFFGLRFGRFSARVQLVFGSFCICSVYRLQRLCSVAVLDCFIYVASKGDVKEFFGLRFGRFSARVQMVFGSFCICSVQMVFA